MALVRMVLFILPCIRLTNTDKLYLFHKYECLFIFSKISDALQIPSSQSAKNHDISPGSLRRSNSSPSVMSGSSDTLSPRDSISDVVQIGPLPKLDKEKSLPKSSDSENSDLGTKLPSQKSESVSTELKEDKVVEKVVKFEISDLDGSSASATAEGIQSKQTQIKSAKVDLEKDVSTSVPKEYTSMLTRQLSPSPASSEASSTLDEVGELPSNLRRHRGHTISAIQQSSDQTDQGSAKGLGSKSTGTNDTTKVGINPSFVFLQLYHSGQLHVNEPPLLLPNNEVNNFYMHLGNTTYIKGQRNISIPCGFINKINL